LFSQNHRKLKDPREAILRLITKNRLTGSTKNKVIVVFDGFPDASFYRQDPCAIQIIYSREETADEKIKKIVESSDNPRNIIVISDDKEIRLSVRALRANPLGVGDFLGSKDKVQRKIQDIVKPELNYSQVSKINQELKKLWLK